MCCNFQKSIIFVKIERMSNVATLKNPLAVLQPEKKRKLFTLQEYLRLEEKSDELHEYYDGIIIKLPMARGPHNIITANVISAINFFIIQENQPFLVFGSQQKVYLPELNYGVYPDALAVSEKPIYFEGNDLLLINPILIIEVLSKSTSKYNRTGKFEEYKTLGSFREYVLIDHKKNRVETHFREEHDLWREKKYTDLNDDVILKSIGCSISMKMIYRNIEV